MNNVSLVTVNWNGLNCLKLLLKSYVKHHYNGEPLSVVIVDNNSTDGSAQWLFENEIPFVWLKENIGHENALNVVFNQIATEYIILNDTDWEYTDNIYKWVSFFLMDYNSPFVSVGEIVENYFEQTKLVDRISPWFWMMNLKRIRESGINYFRDPSCENWMYDVGSWLTEQIKLKGFENWKIFREEGRNQDTELISMIYPDMGYHWGKCSWDIAEHMDRFDEIIRRRMAIEERLNLYDDIDLKDKFKSGLV